MTLVEAVAAARALAIEAHGDQLDKAGRPYIDHPRRVALRLSWQADQAVAWLHDVIEDTPITARELTARGFPPQVVAAVVALTRSFALKEDDTTYYAQVRANPIALRVKLADIDDNTDPRRLVHLDDATVCRLIRKYAKALVALTGEIA